MWQAKLFEVVFLRKVQTNIIFCIELTKESKLQRGRNEIWCTLHIPPNFHLISHFQAHLRCLASSSPVAASPGWNMKAIPPPPTTTDFVHFPSWTPSHCAFPRPSEPTPWRTLINCHVFEASNWVERSNSSTQLQFNDALKPPHRP